MSKITNTNILTVGKNDPTADFNTANYLNDWACLQAAVNFASIQKIEKLKVRYER